MSTPDITALWSGVIRERLDDHLAATGSIGRGEGTVHSDLDVIRLDEGPVPRLQALVDAGIEVDRQGVGPHSGILPRSADEWTAQVHDWVTHPAENRGVVLTGLLADAAHPVRQVAGRVVPDSPIVADMLRDALSTRVPRITGVLSRGTVGLKSELLTPVVKLARWAALASGADALSTPDRLMAADPHFLSSAQVADLQRAFETVLSLQVDLDLGLVPHMAVDRRGGIVLSSLATDTVTDLSKVARTLRGVHKVLAYNLSTSSFSGSR
ncbi:putative nucleotidyltransferase DUF294 [Corynebacterium efficiens YS-314]|nr:putative nucleotidyltransferase DUF294 [Corynebacterium efficiens YS-314]